MNDLKTDELEKEKTMLTFNGFKVDFSSENSSNFDLEYIKFIKPINHVNIIDFYQWKTEFHDGSSLKNLQILYNGNYLLVRRSCVLCERIMVYDLTKKEIVKYIDHKYKVLEVKTIKNQIILISETFENNIFTNRRHKYISILDENLNIIVNKEISNDMITRGFKLIGADESCLYFIKTINDGNVINLIYYDWLMNPIESKIKFHKENKQEAFYIPCNRYELHGILKIKKSESEKLRPEIIQFETKNDLYFTRTNFNCYNSTTSAGQLIIIFDKDGVTLKTFEVEGFFYFNTTNNIFTVLNGSKSIKYFDLHGKSIQHDEFDLPELPKLKSFTDIFLDQKGFINIGVSFDFDSLAAFISLFKKSKVL